MPRQQRFFTGLCSKPGRFLVVLCLSFLLGVVPVLG